VIDLGPQAREIVARFLKPDLTQYLFSPADAEQARREKLAYARKTPLSCGNDAGSNRRGGRTLGARYPVAAYRRAIAARPSMGKSTFMCWTMSGLAIQGTPVGFIHVEENEDKVAGNVLSAESGVENARLD
jgi:hypothetical protein